ncbi:MAG: phenylacetate--CoA ligase family protein [Hyphomicrobiales bacterium]
MRILFKKYIIAFAWWLKGFKILKAYKKLISRERWNEYQWNEYQNKLFVDFVNHCYDNVPYYKNLFDENNIKPEDIKSIKDLHKIPILTKDIVRDNQENLLAKNIDHTLLSKGHTTGSTGKPIVFYNSKRRTESIVAGMWRLYRRCGWKPGEQIASIWGFKDQDYNQSKWKSSLRDFFSGITHLNAWKANDDDFERWYCLIKKRNITVIVCYASLGVRFANWLIDNNKKLDSIKGVFSTSEKLYDFQKKQIEKAFSCKVFNLYGCGEVVHIACTCNEGNMHVNPDMVIVETGEKNEVGDKELIVTGLTNWVMPFLRYTNGDAGDLMDKECTCGLNTPLMDLSVSRLADVFTFSDGKKYSSLYFVLRFYKEGFDGIELFQLHQDKVDHIFLRIVKNEKFTNATLDNIDKAINDIKKHINNEAEIELVFTDYIEQSVTSKHYYAKSDVK